MNVGIVIDTRAVFPNAGSRVQGLHGGPVLHISWSDLWAEISVHVMVCWIVWFLHSYWFRSITYLL